MLLVLKWALKIIRGLIQLMAIHLQGLGISLASGANALATSALIKQEIEQLSKQLPEGYKIVYPRDNTPFVQESIKEVVKTLFEAVLLVVLVMFIFLQNWRATLIPAITVPVVILGTFGDTLRFRYHH